MIRVLNLVLLLSLAGYWHGKSLPNELLDYENPSYISDTIFQKTFKGNINHKIGVVFQIERRGNELSGSYFYVRKGIDIKLTGRITGLQVEMYELDYLNNQIAKISGELKDSIFNGSWQSLNSKKSLPISLIETKAKVEPLPSNIEGLYKTQAKDQQTGDETPCDLAVTITKKDGEYFFRLKTNLRDIKGEVSFMRDIEANETYISFEGIKWAEYGGDMSKPNKKVTTEKSRKIPDSIEGAYSENEIIIQNDGNSMNYYVKLGDCDRKFIRLVKE